VQPHKNHCFKNPDEPEIRDIDSFQLNILLYPCILRFAESVCIQWKSQAVLPGHYQGKSKVQEFIRNRDSLREVKHPGASLTKLPEVPPLDLDAFSFPLSSLPYPPVHFLSRRICYPSKESEVYSSASIDLQDNFAAINNTVVA